MAELSLLSLNQKVNNGLANFQVQLNTKQNLIIETPNQRWFTDNERTKLQNIQTGAEVNQNAFSFFQVGTDTFVADTKTDMMEFVAGDSIKLTSDLIHSKLTIGVKCPVSYAIYADSAGLAKANGGNADTIGNMYPNDFALHGHIHDNTTLFSIDWSKIMNKPTIPTALPASGGDSDTVDGKHATDFAPYAHLHGDGSITDVEWSKITNKPSGYIADGGNSDTVDGKHANDIVNMTMQKVYGLNNKLIFSKPGIYNIQIPENVTRIYLSMCAGGGGGQYNTGSLYVGGGCAGESIMYQNVPVKPNDIIVVTVGEGGFGGTNTTNPTTGGITSFGTIVACIGGLAGNSAFSIGESSLFGVGGNPGQIDGGKGQGFGSGGGAGVSGNGGNGACGLVIIEW